MTERRLEGYGLLAVLLAGCAHVQAPPGGPEDREPPAILSSEPSSDVILEELPGPVVFRFSERISEQGAAEAVLVSPRTSPVVVRPGRQEIRVDLREGWAPGFVYHVTLLPTIRDLFGNTMAEPARIVFSTGPEIPPTELAGRVIDRITAQPVRDARVEAIRVADSLVYAVPSDSVGRFTLDRIPVGEYQVRAFTDLNRDRVLDEFEVRDTLATLIDADESVEVELRILAPDSTPAVITNVMADAGGLRVEFDDYLEADSLPGPEDVDLVHPVAGEIEVVAVSVRPPVAAPPVDPAVTPAPPAPVDPAATPAPAAPVDPTAPPTDPVDPVTPQPVAPTPAQPPAPGSIGAQQAIEPPPRSLTLILLEGVTLEPDVEYRLVIRGVVNLNGASGEAGTTFQVEALPGAAAP